MLLSTPSQQQNHILDASVSLKGFDHTLAETRPRAETHNSFEQHWDFCDSNPRPVTPSNSSIDEIIPVQSDIAINADNSETIRTHIINDFRNIFTQYLSHKDTCAETELNAMANDLLGISLGEIVGAFDTNLKSNLAHTIAQSGLTSLTILSGVGFHRGCHTWSFKVLDCDAYRQEIGVISQKQIQNMDICINDIKTTEVFGARAVYGFSYLRNVSYYGSYNEDSTVRCFKNLSKSSEYHTQWKRGDIIKVCVDIDRGRIKFYVNGIKIRKTLSLEKGHSYYPIISFCYKHNQCKYELLNFT